MAPVRVLRSPPSDVLVLMGILVFVGLFLGTIFVALALPAWRDVHAPPRRVTGTVVALRSVRIDPVGDRLPTGGSKTNYYADVQSPGADALMPVIVGRGLYTRLKQGRLSTLRCCRGRVWPSGCEPAPRPIQSCRPTIRWVTFSGGLQRRPGSEPERSQSWYWQPC
jgi:hypothetical protein